MSVVDSCLVMGIVNVTPDSFSDGGRWFNHADAIARGFDLVDQGADVIDVGGESTRPGAAIVPEAEELRRVIPVIEALADRVKVSVDTRSAQVARSAVRSGAGIINDVSSSLWPVAADTGAAWLATHMQGDPGTMQIDPHYDDVVGEVLGHLEARAELAQRSGVGEIWIDPGIGFGKSSSHNLRLLAELSRFVDTGLPVVVGTSRKGFLGTIAARPGDAALAVEDRLEPSLATAVWAMSQGVRVVRVHDVRATVDASQLVGPCRIEQSRRSISSSEVRT